jgi:hypothetical protein
MTIERSTVPGLHIEHWENRAGFAVSHDNSGLRALPPVRLRRHAEAQLADLAATGVDFTVPSGKMRRSGPEWAAYAQVYALWNRRTGNETHDPETGEYYSTHVPYGDCRIEATPGVRCPRCASIPAGYCRCRQRL